MRVSPPESVREIIRNANFVSSELLIGLGINESWILKNGVKVLFKPSEGEYKFEARPGVAPGTQYLREKAGSLVDEILGLGLVPPTEIITPHDCHGIGSAQLYMEGFETANRLVKRGKIEYPGFQYLTLRQRQDWQLFDELIGSMDRISSNWMLRSRKDGGVDLALIDNGLCLSDKGYTLLRAKPASGQPIDPVNIERLKMFLDCEHVWRPKFQKLINDSAINHMYIRASQMLTRGYYVS